MRMNSKKEKRREWNRWGRERGLKNRKEYIEERTKHCCERCGNKYHPDVFDFHHRDPTTKKFNLGFHRWRKIVTDKETLEEADKCDILCANCHREVHLEMKRDEDSIRHRSQRTTTNESVVHSS